MKRRRWYAWRSISGWWRRKRPSESTDRDTTAERCGVAGLRGLIAVRNRPPDELSRIFEGSGALDGGPCPLDSIFDSLISQGTAMIAIRSPRGVMEDLPSSSRRPRPAEAHSR